MARIQGGQPPLPPRDMTPARQLYLERARQYFGQLSTDLGAGLAAEGLTRAALQQHWSTQVRPATHPWIRGSEHIVAQAAAGRWNKVRTSAGQHMDFLIAKGIESFTTVPRDPPEIFAATCGALTWGVLTLDNPSFTMLGQVMYPQLPPAWQPFIYRSLPLLGITTFQLYPRRSLPNQRHIHEEQDFCAAFAAWAQGAFESIRNDLPPCPSEYFSELTTDCRQLILAGLGRVLVHADALEDEHLKTLFEMPLIPGVLWMLAQADATTASGPWYRMLHDPLRTEIRATTSSAVFAGLIAIGVHTARREGDTLGVQWFETQARHDRPWSEDDTSAVVHIIQRVIASVADCTARDEELNSALGWLCTLTPPDDQAPCWTAVLLAHLFQIHVCEAFLQRPPVPAAPMRAAIEASHAAAQRAWDHLVAITRPDITAALSPAARLQQVPAAEWVLIVTCVDLAHASGGQPAIAIVCHQLQALFERLEKPHLVALVTSLPEMYASMLDL